MLAYPHIDPAIFSIGPLQIRWYSLMYVVGLAAIYLHFRRAAKNGDLPLTPDQVESIMIRGLIGMVVGARLFYIVFYNLHHYIDNPQDIAATWRGGLSFHGGLVGILVSIGWYCRQQKLRFFEIIDHVALMIPVGLGFGRIGNFINGELWGRVTDVPWGMVFPDGGPQPRHPSQLYESFAEGPVLFLIIWSVKKILGPKRPQGVLTATALIAYSFLRFFLEFFREPDEQLGIVLGPFSMGQLLCMAMLLLGIVVLSKTLMHRTAPARA